MPVLDVDGLIQDRARALRAFHDRAGAERAELDVSGGIDSAVMLGLLARALGPASVTAVHTAIHSDPAALARSREAAEAFGVALIEMQLTATYEGLLEGMLAALQRAGYDRKEVLARMEFDPTVQGSLRSCLRAPVGRGFNRLTGGGIRHGTGNECEDRWLRFYQKGGDGEVDTNPIAMLTKGEVYQLARGLGVPRSIRTAVPTPDLWARGDRHTDEEELRGLTGVDWTYSRVSPDTGEYTELGTIESLSRFLDGGGEADLFGEERPDWESLGERALPFFPGRGPEQVLGLLESARGIERASRHKMNPNLPALGDREALIAAGLLTNALPDTSPAA